MMIDTDILVDLSEVAASIGLDNPRGVSVYRRRYADFPAPVITKGRCVLWLRSDVEAWTLQHRDRPGTEVDHTSLELNIAGLVVGYELDQMLEAAELYEHHEPGPLRNALVESMLLHARILIEFLLSRGQQETDILPRQLYPGWRLPSGNDLDWLREQKKLIDQHLAHLTWARVDHLTQQMRPKARKAAVELEGPEWDFGTVAARLVGCVHDFHRQAVAAGHIDPMHELGQRLGEAEQLLPRHIDSTVMATTSSTL
jgi:predicted DNA-binding transcriptional regulator AlpA